MDAPTDPVTPDDRPIADTGPPAVVEQVDQRQIAHFVSQIKSSEQQVGEHIIRALQSDGTSRC